MNNNDKIIAALKELGPTAMDVYLRLNWLGFKGKRGGSSCPIHNYLLSKRLIERGDIGWINAVVSSEVLKGVADFIRSFGHW
jgi:hypothetical protein